MTRSMMEVNFPQYIHREARDFFYLTRRALLPGWDIELPGGAAGGEPGDGVWRVKGLPQHGFPYAVATTELRFGSARARVLRVDPKAIRPAASAGTAEDTPTIVSLFSGASPASAAARSLWWQDEVFVVGASPGPRATRVASGAARGAAGAERVAVAGVEDLDGMLDWVELDAAAPEAVEAAERLLAQLGCSSRLVVDAGKAILGGGVDLAGQTVTPPPPPFVRFVRGATPSARRYFADTKVVSPAVWQPLQSKRVRYFPKPSRPAASASASAAPAVPASAGPTPPSPPSPPSPVPSAARPAP